MDPSAARSKFNQQNIARLATVSGDGIPHLVPLVFVLIGSVIYSAVDGKPKKSTKLKRLANIAANPHVSLIVDEYDEDWAELWWVRADGTARLLGDSDPEAETAVEALIAKYSQYQNDPALRPRGQVIAVDVRSWHGWEAS